MSWGLEAHLLSPGEARALIPMLSKRILGALYVPSDIQTRATRPAEAMAREAEAAGATLHGGVKVTGFGIAGGRITVVHTNHGEIRTEVVVAAAGIWAPKLGGLAGVPIPLSPMQHLYAVTTPLPELDGADGEITQPILRHQDEAMYFRQVGGSATAWAPTSTSRFWWMPATSPPTRRPPPRRPRCPSRPITSRRPWRRRARCCPASGARD